MKTPALHCNAAPATATVVRTHRRPGYRKVTDARKRPIRGLWVRQGRFYAQLTVEDAQSGQKSVRRVALMDPETKQPVKTPAEAVAALERLKVQRADNALPVLSRTPKLSQCVKRYFESLSKLADAKRPSTVSKEKASLKVWTKKLGEVRVDRISKSMINTVREERQVAGKSARTVNLDVIALRGVLKFAIDNDWLKTLPFIKPLKVTSPKRNLFTAEQIEKLCSVAFEPRFCKGRLAKADEKGKPLKNAQQFMDYIHLMCYCGSRRDETLRIKWKTDVDWVNKQLTIGSDGLSKNRTARQVDFNPPLEAHLKDMHARRVPDSDYLFPSPQRGKGEDEPTRTFKESLNLARAAAAMPGFGFHDCRHYFVSACVMSGTDFMTIAKWAGHRDGGVLIGKVYGHLSNEHAQQQAGKVRFGIAKDKPSGK